MSEELYKNLKKDFDKIIPKFLKDWLGLKFLCRDDNEAWEYWLKTYKKWEEKLK